MTDRSISVSFNDIVRPTRIEPRDARQEEALAAALAAEAYETVLVASDLHLGQGRDPRTRNFPITENFFEGEAFRRWLGVHGRPGAASLLLLNGDVFDFLRVTAVPRGEEEIVRWQARLRELGRDVDRGTLTVNRTERRFGLKTHDYRTVWKLGVMADGHRAFFAALAEWISGGNALLIVKGNHDVELHWPLVRLAVRDLLERNGAPAGAAQERVGFVDDGIAVGNVWFEHGHRHEPMTAVDGGPTLPGSPDEINLPTGSFVNRYFINNVETLDPFIDNIRPTNQALLALLRRYPLVILETYFRAWKFLAKAIGWRKPKGPVLLIGLGLIVPPVVAVLVIASFLFPDFRALLGRLIPGQAAVERVVAALGILTPVLMPYILGAVTEVSREVVRVFRNLTGRSQEEDEYVHAAREAMAKAFGRTAFRRLYAVFGHTHDPRAVAVGEGPREETYLNDGTWTAVWPRERPDLAGRVVRSFIRFDRDPSTGEYVHTSLVWDDSAGQAREAVIMILAREWNQRRALAEAERTLEPVA